MGGLRGNYVLVGYPGRVAAALRVGAGAGRGPAALTTGDGWRPPGSMPGCQLLCC